MPGVSTCPPIVIFRLEAYSETCIVRPSCIYPPIPEEALMAANDIETLADFGIFDEAGVARLAELIRSVQQLASGGMIGRSPGRPRGRRPGRPRSQKPSRPAQGGASTN